MIGLVSMIGSWASPGKAAIEALVVGIIATLATDLWLWLLQIVGVPPANWGLVGRWVGWMPRGVFVHRPIAATPAADCNCNPIVRRYSTCSSFCDGLSRHTGGLALQSAEDKTRASHYDASRLGHQRTASALASAKRAAPRTRDWPKHATGPRIPGVGRAASHAQHAQP